MIEKNRQGEVWVYAEIQDTTLQEVSLELCCKARQLADKLGVSVGAVLLGYNTELISYNIEKFAKPLISYGVDHVYLVEDSALADFRTDPYAHVLVELIKKHRPQIVLYGATHQGRDLAPRVASATRSGLTADCTDLDISDVTEKSGVVHKNLLLQIRPAFGGNIVATIVNYDQWPQMATVREGVMPMRLPDPNRNGNIIRETIGLTDQTLFAVEVIKREVQKQKLNLKGSRVIVAGGAGVGSKENFDLIFNLAGTFGGAVGASRAAVDSGFVGHEHQIGQTGTTVRPALYIACGISGAIQHRAGMEDSAKIIAINSDKDAPIFSIAHYGIIGDLKQVIPMMIKAFKERV
ncbi:MAG: electron transfer flavoprotein subunit alpha/FixB family protein [Planctomycetaceae bacterium]|jgi:electron transfer flavoprotein alpha subunit|nr:electron transfer flavoprotein subunit alpha/FixB family protein [Planctomycetaceae bacterium]